MKCTVPISYTKRGKAVECGDIAHRFVGSKGFCLKHKAEAFKATAIKADRKRKQDPDPVRQADEGAGHIG